MPAKIDPSLCSHDLSMEDETQHYVSDTRFWFLMRCDLCHKVMKVFATIDFFEATEFQEEE